VIRRSDVAEYFDSMRAKGASVETVNRTLRTMKAVLFFALERELLERNVMQRFRPFEGGKEERRVNRDAYSESEVQAILAAAKTQERALIGLLALAGLRPGEAYALDWSDVDLDGGCLRVVRSWDHRGGQFVEPKTKAGNRTVPISGCLVEALSAQSDKTGLVFANARIRGRQSTTARSGGARRRPRIGADQAPSWVGAPRVVQSRDRVFRACLGSWHPHLAPMRPDGGRGSSAIARAGDCAVLPPMPPSEPRAASHARTRSMPFFGRSGETPRRTTISANRS
jgi:integrase